MCDCSSDVSDPLNYNITKLETTKGYVVVAGNILQKPPTTKGIKYHVRVLINWYR